MWGDILVFVVFWMMILGPGIMAIDAGTWGTAQDGGYERGRRLTRKPLV